MQNVTGEFLARECGFKDAYIRQLLIAGKRLSGHKPDGKAWAIDLDLPLNREFLTKHRKPTVQDTLLATDDTQQIRKQPTVELPTENTQLIRELVNEIKELSAANGRAGLLVDNLKEKEHDAQYWKEKYFELQSKYEALLLESTKKVEAEKARKWWQIKVI